MDYEHNKETHMKAMADPEYREGQRQFHINYWTKDKRDEHSIRMQALVQTDEWQDNLQSGIAAAAENPIHRENYLKARYNPITLMKQIDGIKEYWSKEENRKEQSKRLNKPKTKKKQSNAAIKRWESIEFYIKNSGPNHHNWKGGASFHPYCREFSDKDYREWLKQRDNYTCQNPYCKKITDIIHLHHINHNKKDCTPNNFIVVCPSCNGRANFHIKYWERLYKRIRKYGFNPILMFE